MLGVFTQLFENNAMLHIYIDESGDLGVCGSYFFVMAAVVFLCDSSAKRGTRLVRKMRKRMGVNELKSSRMGFIERQAALNKLMLIRDVEFFYLIAEKPHVNLLQNNYPTNLVYNYFAKLLVDEIFASYNEKMRIIFDARTTKVQSMNSLKDYLLIDAFANYARRYDNIEIMQEDSRAVNNLQLADLVSGTIYQAYTREKRHFLDIMGRKIRSANEFPALSFSRKLFRENDGSLLRGLRKMTSKKEKQSFDSAPALL